MPRTGFIKFFVFLISLFVLTFSISCRKDLDFESNPNVSLRFSKDTIFLDTIFTQSNSETYLLKVYNTSSDDISLSNLYLNQRENSSFRINVDGVPGFEFSEVPLRANDSLMIFVELAMGDATHQLIEEDELVFDDSQQQVKLLAMIEEASYHYPADGEDFVYINQDTDWNNDKSHVILGTVKVDNASLNVAAGTKIYFYQNSGMSIENNANLNLNGSLENPILIRSSRHDVRYDSLPKQWKEISLINANLLSNYTIVKGGENGFNLNNSTANINNTQIYNMSSSGIKAENANITGKNVVISDAGDTSLKITKGGNYNFYYSTFANIWKTGIVGVNGTNLPAYLNNYGLNASGAEVYNDLNANFANCIFYGRSPNGVILKAKQNAAFNYNFDTCLIKNEDTGEINYATDSNFTNTLYDNPLFISTIFSQQDLRLQEESPAINAGNNIYNSMVPNDIKNVLRDNSPNIGAYE